jgi:hypothetical protein
VGKERHLVLAQERGLRRLVANDTQGVWMFDLIFFHMKGYPVGGECTDTGIGIRCARSALNHIMNCH